MCNACCTAIHETFNLMLHGNEFRVKVSILLKRGRPSIRSFVIKTLRGAISADYTVSVVRHCVAFGMTHRVCEYRPPRRAEVLTIVLRAKNVVPITVPSSTDQSLSPGWHIFAKNRGRMTLCG